tara:strand:- start:1757 stop:2263 length:507 start_codon:yes stop_codon:yes gene_type:complete
MDFSQFNSLEQLNIEYLNYLENSIINIIKDTYTINEIYLMGSFCFNIKESKDIDIGVMIPENEAIVDVLYPPSNPSIFYMFKEVFSGLLTRKINKPASILPYNINTFFSTNPITIQVKPPMYNLTKKYWVNKKEGDKFNNFIIRDKNKAWIIDRDSNKGKIITQEKYG